MTVQVGDKVRCVEAPLHSAITIGEIYTIRQIVNDFHNVLVRLEEVGGGYWARRFRPLSAEETPRLRAQAARSLDLLDRAREAFDDDDEVYPRSPAIIEDRRDGNPLWTKAQGDAVAYAATDAHDMADDLHGIGTQLADAAFDKRAAAGRAQEYLSRLIALCGHEAGILALKKDNKLKQLVDEQREEVLGLEKEASELHEEAMWWFEGANAARKRGEALDSFWG